MEERKRSADICTCTDSTVHTGANNVLIDSLIVREREKVRSEMHIVTNCQLRADVHVYVRRVRRIYLLVDPFAAIK